MRYLLVSDIHANAHAFDAVLADAATIGYDAAVCLGDLVGYGADPRAVMEKMAALKPVVIIRGNHDKVCAGLEPAVLFNDVARRSVEWTRETLSQAELKTLADLPKGPKIVTDGIEICHGSPFDEDHYVFTAEDAGRSIEAASARVCFFGHTHLPAIYTVSEDPATHAPGLEDDEVILPRSGPALINVGSVGQPRDGDPRAAYGILDLRTHTLRLRRIPYDIKGAQQRILQAGLPPWLALRLERGQ